jgi:peptidyl-tRNA hydrolase
VLTTIQKQRHEEQKAFELRFIVDRTRQEAYRKRIETARIAEFQAAINKAISDKIIEWKGAEAKKRRAEPPNATVVVIGPGNDGLPSILSAASGSASAGGD